MSSLEDVRGNTVEIENLQFAEAEMLDNLSGTVNAYRQGETTSDDLAYELDRVYDSIHCLSQLTDEKLIELNKQIDTLTYRNARGLKV